jgi:hypothetical protein
MAGVKCHSAASFFSKCRFGAVKKSHSDTGPWHRHSTNKPAFRPAREMDLHQFPLHHHRLTIHFVFYLDRFVAIRMHRVIDTIRLRCL